MATKQKKFEDFLVSRCEYMRCFVAGGVVQGSKPHVQLSSKVVHMASMQLHFVPYFDCTTASRLVDIVTTSILVPADKHELIVRLNDKVDLEECNDDPNPGPSSGSGGPSSGSIGLEPADHPTLVVPPRPRKQISQEHNYLHNYGPRHLWDTICDKAVSMDTKLGAFALFLFLVGMRWLAEKTAAAATSLCRHFSLLQ